MILENFEYHFSTLELYRGNPLIEALPDFLEYSIIDISKALRESPLPCNPRANRRQRDQWLGTLVDKCFIPLPRHIQLLEVIDLMIRQGYVNRNPRQEKLERERLENAYKRQHAGERILMTYGSTQKTTPLSVSVLGCSGVGKTCAVSRILSLYPQVLKHKAGRVGSECIQIVYLRVECPHEGSVKSLCINAIAAIDQVTGEHFSNWAHSRRSIEELKARLSQLLTIYHVGLLVLDEMQNIMANRQNRDTLFNFLVSISNTLYVPLMFISTPKIAKFMELDFKTSRRFGSFGTFKWDRLKNTPEDHAEWDIFINELSQYSILMNESQSMPEDVKSAFYYYSQGVPDILLKLFIISQKKAQVLKMDRLTPELISNVFRESFSVVATAIDAIRRNDPIAIAEYQDIAMPNSSFQNISDEISDEIAKNEFMSSDFKQPENDLKSRVKISLEQLGIELTPSLDQALESIITGDQHLSPVAVLSRILDEYMSKDNKKKTRKKTAHKKEVLPSKPVLPIDTEGNV